MRIGWAAVGAAMALAGCDRLPNPVVSGSPPALPYAGSLTARATQALECDGKPYDGGTGYYDSGLASVQGDATAALKNYFHEEFSQVPRRGYRIEAKRDGRVLFSYDVNGLSQGRVHRR